MTPQYTEINKHGDKLYYSDKQMKILHREDGPAIEWEYGDIHWYLNGKFHREDGPAIERVNGYKCWYLKGKCHREDGPAVEYANGDKRWYLNDIRYSEEDFNKKMNNTPKLQQTADSECKPETYSLWRTAFKNVDGKMESVNSTTDLFVWACVNTKTGEVEMEEVRSYDDELDADLVEGWEWRRFRLVEATV